MCVSIFRAQVDLFSKNLLLVPIHLEVHWCLVTADSVKKRICIYDSQGNALQKVARVTADFMYLFIFCHSNTRLALLLLYLSLTNCRFFKLFFFCLPIIEHPEIFNDGSKGEEANSF